MKYTATCEECGQTFMADRNTQRFCSRACRNKAANRKSRSKELEPMAEQEKDVEAMPEQETKALDTQVGGSHYAVMKIQPLDFIVQNGLGFCEGNIIKYLSRYRRKNGLEDLLKARQYLDILIESERKETLTCDEN